MVDLGEHLNSGLKVSIPQWQLLTFLGEKLSVSIGNSDLHKLWYVLLKERNKLMSDRLLALQLNQEFAVQNNIRKVSLSMCRLLTVVNERKKLREKYRMYLENQYIQEKKNEEIRERLVIFYFGNPLELM